MSDDWRGFDFGDADKITITTSGAMAIVAELPGGGRVTAGATEITIERGKLTFNATVIPNPSVVSLPPVGSDCPACDGSGVYEENHGQGLTERLGCSDCAATGKVHTESCGVWENADHLCTCGATPTVVT